MRLKIEMNGGDNDKESKSEAMPLLQAIHAQILFFIDIVLFLSASRNTDLGPFLAIAHKNTSMMIANCNHIHTSSMIPPTVDFEISLV